MSAFENEIRRKAAQARTENPELISAEELVTRVGKGIDRNRGIDCQIGELDHLEEVAREFVRIEERRGEVGEEKTQEALRRLRDRLGPP
jgi:hypothetical protein